jgi:thiol-disulfide isomerase/thioredoxin
MLGTASTPADNAALPVPLKTYTGKILYIDFWASWCGPCAQSFPWLNQIQAKFGDRLTIVAVNVDTDTASAKAFLSRHPAAFDVVYDPAGELADRYHINGMPSTVILAADGHLLHQHSGFYDAKTGDYEAAIRDALQKSTPSTGNVP